MAVHRFKIFLSPCAVETVAPVVEAAAAALVVVATTPVVVHGLLLDLDAAPATFAGSAFASLLFPPPLTAFSPLLASRPRPPSLAAIAAIAAPVAVASASASAAARRSALAIAGARTAPAAGTLSRTRSETTMHAQV